MQNRKATTHCRSFGAAELAAEPNTVLEQIGLLFGFVFLGGKLCVPACKT